MILRNRVLCRPDAATDPALVMFTTASYDFDYLMIKRSYCIHILSQCCRQTEPNTGIASSKVFCPCSESPCLHSAPEMFIYSSVCLWVCFLCFPALEMAKRVSFNRGEQREDSTGRQAAKPRDLTPACHANPSDTSYLLRPISWASKGGNIIRWSFIMMETKQDRVFILFLTHQDKCNVCRFIKAVRDCPSFSTSIQSGHVVRLVTVCLQKKKRGNHND